MYRIASISIALVLLFFATASGQAPAVASVGQSAPDFRLEDRQGKVWRLSELKGQVVFAYFWASWCPPCRGEMNTMESLYTKLPGDKFKMLAIINSDKPEIANAFAAKLGLTMPILYDQHNTVGSKYGLQTLPCTYIIDKNGVLRDKIVSPILMDRDTLKKKLDGYINE